MQDGVILVTITLLSSVVTIGRFLYEYRDRVSCCTCQSASDIVEPTTAATMEAGATSTPA